MTYAQVKAFIDEWIVTNGNNEITALVLNPVLQNITDQINELTGALADLTTTDTSDLVAAINSIKSEIDNLSGVQVYEGIADPNLTPPPSYNIADFYILTDGDTVYGLFQYNGVSWIEITNLIDDSYTGLDKTWSSTKINGLLSAINNPIGYLELRLYMKGSKAGVPNTLPTLEEGDFVKGLKDANTLWESAIYTGGDVEDRSNYRYCIEVDITGLPL
jgi:hypothetical protein